MHSRIITAVLSVFLVFNIIVYAEPDTCPKEEAFFYLNINNYTVFGTMKTERSGT
ncbi:MAG: hypothetical protein ACOX3L_13485 [Lutisporaceae bacterium]